MKVTKSLLVTRGINHDLSRLTAVLHFGLFVFISLI